MRHVHLQPSRAVWLGVQIRVIADELCAPELRQYELERIAGAESRYVDGWMKQQLVKLACSFAISTPFYLITDADMFFLHDLGALDLMEQTECGKTSGVCDKDAAIAFRALNEMQAPSASQAQKAWISNSAATLNVRNGAHLLNLDSCMARCMYSRSAVLACMLLPA